MTGAEAEDRACALLERRGLRLLARNVRSRRGEIDLVMRDGPTLVFVEVRARAAGARVAAIDSVDAHKCRRLQAAAQRYLDLHPELAEEPMRFDLVHFAGERGGWRRDVLQFDGR